METNNFENEIYYIKEIYVDDYNTLQQSILINVSLDKESKGEHSKTLRSYINPNLHLSKIEYLDINMKRIRHITSENEFEKDLK